MNSDNPLYWLASTDEVSNEDYRADLKRAVAAKNIGEREWLTAIQDALLRVDLKGGRILRPVEDYPIPLVDEIIKSDRYMRDFMRSGHCEHAERDKLIDLYFRITAPTSASGFGR